MSYRIADIMKVLKCDETHANIVLNKMEEYEIRFSECTTTKFNKIAKEANNELKFEEWYINEGKNIHSITMSDADYFYNNVLPTLK